MSTPRQPARRPRTQPAALRGPQGPRQARRRAGRNRESFGELVVKLVALVVFVLVIVPMILNGIPERIAEVTPPAQSSPPAAAVPVSPEQAPPAPTG